MSIFKNIFTINLQLFADGGASGAASGNGAGDSGTGVKTTSAETMLATSKKASKNPLADVKYGIQAETKTAEPETIAEKDKPTANDSQVDRVAEFEKLIKGDYKDLYDAKMQETVKSRLKGSKETVDKYNALTPTLEMLAKKYGVDASDINALNKAISEDNTFYEKEAMEKGVTVEQLKTIRKFEMENAELKRQMQEEAARRNADKLYAGWMEQADKAKAVYPTFDLQAELQNPKFIDLLRSNIDVRTAYEVLHKDEIIPAAMQFATKKTTEQVVNNIIANGARPIENGNHSQSSAIVKSDVSQLTKADRQEIARRVARGEKITF